MSRGVIGGGNFIVDYVRTIDHYPTEQTLANIEGEFSGSGGAPYNVLLALSKLGAAFPLRAVGRIGDDEAGRFIVEDCQAHGIDTSCLRVTEGSPTSYTLVMVAKSTGKRTFFHRRGANDRIHPDDFDFAGLAGYHFHYGYLMLADQMDAPDAEFGTAAARVLSRAKQAGLTTSIDLVSEDSERFSRIVPPALEYADIAFMNEFEAARLTGFGLDSAATGPVARAREQLGFSGTLVVHWEEGSMAAAQGGQLAIQGSVQVPIERIASVAGSGDAFAAGYLLAYLRNESPQESLRCGVSVAAACITGFTCTDGIVSEAKCLELASHYGYRDL